MSRGFVRGLSDIAMLIGFVSVIFGGLGLTVMTLNPRYSLGAVLGGFLLFLIGVELYLHSREDHY